MSAFGGGSTPHVGQVLALRTFRLADDGALLPVIVDKTGPWASGVNEATCTRTSGHQPPEADCTCGFYGYSDPGWVEYRQQRHVVAVVECSGRTTVGTRGVRTQRARIVAIWFSKGVSADVRQRCRRRYPEVSVFSSRAGMLMVCPPTMLEHTMDPQPRRRRLIEAGLAVVVAASYLMVACAVVCVLMGWAPLGLSTAPHDSGRALWTGLATAVCVPLVGVVLGGSRFRSDVVMRLLRHLSTAGIGLWLILGGWPYAPSPTVVLLMFGVVALAVGRELGQSRFHAVHRSLHLERFAADGPWTLDPGYPQWVDSSLVHLLRGASTHTVLIVQPLGDGAAAKDDGYLLRRDGNGVRLKADVQIWCGSGSRVTVRTAREGRRGGHDTAVVSVNEVWALLDLPPRVWHPPTLRASRAVMDEAAAARSADIRVPSVPFAWPYRTLLCSDPEQQAAVDDALVVAERRWYRSTQAEIAATDVDPAAHPAIVQGRRGDLSTVAAGWLKLLQMEHQPGADEAISAVAALFSAVEGEIRDEVVLHVTQQVLPSRSRAEARLGREGFVGVRRAVVHEVLADRVTFTPRLHLRSSTGSLIVASWPFGRADGAVAVLVEVQASGCSRPDALGARRSLDSEVVVVDGEVVAQPERLAPPTEHGGG